MMNFKHTSQLAMLSVLLTFTHAIGQTSGGQGAVSSELVSQNEEFVIESQRVKRQQRLARYQEQKLQKQKEAKEKDQSVAPKQAAKAITFKKLRPFSERANTQDKKQPSVVEQSNSSIVKQDDSNNQNHIQENSQSTLATIIKPVMRHQNKVLSQWSLLSLLRRSPHKSRQGIVKGEDVVEASKQMEQEAAIRVVNRMDINQYGSTSDKPITLSTVMISKDSQEMIFPTEKAAAKVLSQGAVPSSYDQVIVKAETEGLVQKQAKEARMFRLSNLKESLTLNKEKAAQTRAERNAKRKAASQDRIDRKKEASSVKRVVNHQASSQDSYKQAQDKGNSNVDAYVQANQYQCDSNATDWPCNDCVVKRRANIGISICTMIVTVIAIIVGAIIISNASDTPNKGTTKP